MTTDTEALPPLPKKRRAMLCTKCGFSGHTEAEASPRGAPCQRCDYTAFVQEIDYSDEEMRAYARAALAQRQQVSAITDAMVDVYLQANDAYWREVDAMHTDPTKPWRQGTPKEATRVSLAAALTAAPSAQAEPQPLKRGITGICTRSTCECESSGLGLECVWLRPTDAEMERRTGEPHIDGWPLYSGLPPAQPQEPPRSAPLTFDQLQSVMSQHFGGRELTDDEADSAEAFARAIERAHGINTPEEKR